MNAIHRSLALLPILSAVALGLVPCSGALAEAPGPNFALVPVAKPGWSDAFGAGPAGLDEATRALARTTASKAAPNWGTPEPAEAEPAPKPGSWSATIDPIEGNEVRSPGADTSKIADLMYGLGLQQLTLRLTHHF